MSDYLDILLGRVMDQKPSIHPRLPSIFEPSSDGTPSTLLVQEDESIARPPNTGESKQTAVAIAVQPHVEEKPGYSHEMALPPSLSPGGPVAAHPESATIQVLVPNSYETQSMQDGNNARREAIEHYLKIDLTQPSKAPAATALPTLEVESQLVDPAVSNLQSAPSTQGTAAPMAAIPSQAEHASIQTPSVPAPIPTLEEEMSALIVKPTPRVTVHIGRIDIRVARQQDPASSRKHPAAQRKPVMSLDHYLRERSKGKP